MRIDVAAAQKAGRLGVIVAGVHDAIVIEVRQIEDGAAARTVPIVRVVGPRLGVGGLNVRVAGPLGWPRKAVRVQLVVGEAQREDQIEGLGGGQLIKRIGAGRCGAAGRPAGWLGRRRLDGYMRDIIILA